MTFCEAVMISEQDKGLNERINENELIAFNKQIESKIDAADRKHELRERKRQYENMYLSADEIVEELDRQ